MMTQMRNEHQSAMDTANGGDHHQYASEPPACLSPKDHQFQIVDDIQHVLHRYSDSVALSRSGWNTKMSCLKGPRRTLAPREP